MANKFKCSYFDYSPRELCLDKIGMEIELTQVEQAQVEEANDS